jgi:hypothetical protein
VDDARGSIRWLTASTDKTDGALKRLEQSAVYAIESN